MRKTGGLDGWRGTVALAVALFAAQAALWINPGYFSHDELQWGARAAVGSGRSLPFLSFTDWHTFQFRPLTFNLWLLLSQSLFDSPRLFHALFAALGAANALLLVKVLRAAGCRRAVAFGAALAFTFSPSAAWVHGWVGCLADLLWVGLGLALVVFLQHCAAAETRDSDARSTPGPAGTWAIAAVAALLTALALLSKEAALSIPALLGLAAVLLRPPRVWRLAAFASGAVAVLYLALRLETLTAPDAASSYAVQFGALPLRLGEYALFPWALGMQEVAAMARADPPNGCGWRWRRWQSRCACGAPDHASCWPARPAACWRWGRCWCCRLPQTSTATDWPPLPAASRRWPGAGWGERESSPWRCWPSLRRYTVSRSRTGCSRSAACSPFSRLRWRRRRRRSRRDRSGSGPSGKSTPTPTHA